VKRPLESEILCEQGRKSSYVSGAEAPQELHRQLSVVHLPIHLTCKEGRGARGVICLSGV
jgi:hypothetical protein